MLDVDEREVSVAVLGAAGTIAPAIVRDLAASDEVAAGLSGVDVLVNTVSYRINLDAMRACLKAGCTYLDLGGLYWVTGRQLELGPEFER